MVNFENLKIGSRVQTSKDGEIFQGTVRYKGGLITREGNWVGVELDKPGTVLVLHTVYMAVNGIENINI